VAGDGVIYNDQIETLAEVEAGKDKWKPVCVLLPVRLGLETFNLTYTENFKVWSCFCGF
jgi:hypothetical protein